MNYLSTRYFISVLSLEKVPFDSTGMFHWCPDQKMDDCIITRSDPRLEELVGHILVIVNAEVNSALLGLRSFIMPLRASNFHYHELKEIVFLGERAYLEREWEAICNFPKLKIMCGSALKRADLQNAQRNDKWLVDSYPETAYF